MNQDDLERALSVLSAAHGPTALAAAFRDLQREVRKKRRDPDAGRLATAVQEALAIRDQMHADGVTGAALNTGLEGVLRDFWPKPHRDAWQDICPQCRDYGVVMHQCLGDDTCGRRFLHGPHDYAKPCLCAKGKRFTEKQKTTPDDADTKAAKQRKPSKLWR